VESHAPPLLMNQLFVYLRDHLLLGTDCRYQYYKVTCCDFVKAAIFPLSTKSCLEIVEEHGSRVEAVDTGN
jgi:hypothetical protein